MIGQIIPQGLLSLLTWDGTNYTVAAGTTDTLASTEIDMQGYDSLLVIACIGAIASSGSVSIVLKNSATSATYGSGTVDNIGTAIANSADTDDNKLFLIEVNKPQRRYIKVYTTRATGNVTPLALVAIRYNAGDQPTTQSTSVGGVEASTILNSPTPSAT